MSENSENILKKIEKFLEKILQGFVCKYNLKILKETNQYRIVIECVEEKDVEKIFGENGENLVALQHIIRMLIHKIFPKDKIHFILDVNDLKQERENVLLQKIPEITNEMVIKKGKIVVLTGLSGYERLIVHDSLRDVKSIETQSVGVHNNRKLLILPTSEIGSQGMEDSVILDIEKIKKLF